MSNIHNKYSQEYLHGDKLAKHPDRRVMKYTCLENDSLDIINIYPPIIK